MATFTNQARLTYNDRVTNSNLVIGEITQVLSATKTALSDTYGTDSTVTYIISIVNSGNTAFSGLTLSDDLGAYTYNMDTLYPLTYVTDSIRYYVNGVLQSPPTITDEQPLVITGINVPANQNAMIVYQASVNQFAPLGPDSSINNTVTITGAGLTTPLTAEATINVDEEPRLTISKNVFPLSVAENGQLTYTFTIINTGSAPATVEDNVQITDTFVPPLSNISVRFNNTNWSSPANYTYDEDTGLFQTVAGQITVPAATYTRDATTGAWVVTPGVSTITIVGTI